MLGVLNELAEYLFELLGMGIFSLDTHDTWRDFVANTTGALLTWAICLPVLSNLLQLANANNNFWG